MRILIVSDVFPPLIGGVELQMQLLSRKLQQRGHAVMVATPQQRNAPEFEIEHPTAQYPIEAEKSTTLSPVRESELAIQIHRITPLTSKIPGYKGDPRRNHHPPLPDPGTIIALRRLIKHFQPDVIHAYGWIVYACSLATLGSNVPILLSVREYGYTCAVRTMMQHGEQLCSGPALGKCIRCANDFYGIVKGSVAVGGIWSGRKLLQQRISGIHSVSHYMKQNIERDLFADNVGNRPSVVIPSFRDSDAPPPNTSTLQPYLDQLPNKPFILFVGALRRVKGLEPLLAAYQGLENAPPLVLIGRLATDTPKQFPSNVTICYDFPHAAVMAAWERALFGVAPSIWPEPFGSVIHEAMSQGKAVIGTTPGGQTDMIVDHATGLLTPANDTAALQAAMQTLINDPRLCQQLGAAGREQAELFMSDTIVPRFEKLYEQLITSATSAQNGRFTLAQSKSHYSK